MLVYPVTKPLHSDSPVFTFLPALLPLPGTHRVSPPAWESTLVFPGQKVCWLPWIWGCLLFFGFSWRTTVGVMPHHRILICRDIGFVTRGRCCPHLPGIPGVRSHISLCTYCSLLSNNTQGERIKLPLLVEWTLKGSWANVRAITVISKCYGGNVLRCSLNFCALTLVVIGGSQLYHCHQGFSYACLFRGSSHFPYSFYLLEFYLFFCLFIDLLTAAWICGHSLYLGL
jgi:hypothetical protein